MHFQTCTVVLSNPAVFKKRAACKLTTLRQNLRSSRHASLVGRSVDLREPNSITVEHKKGSILKKWVIYTQFLWLFGGSKTMVYHGLSPGDHHRNVVLIH